MPDLGKITDFFKSLSWEKVLPSIAVLVIGLVVIKLILKFYDAAMRRTKLEPTTFGFLRAILKVLLFFVLALVFCGMIGINVTSLVALFSVVTLAISLSMQNALTNVVSGVILLSNKPFKVGDFVEIGQKSGTVQELGMFYTKLATPDNRLIDMPNSNIMSNEIVNYSVLGTRRVDLNVTASYDAEPSLVVEALLEAANQPCTLFTPEPEAFINRYGDSSIEYILRVWATCEDYWKAYMTVTAAIHSEFKKRNIEMTYPHMNVHIESHTPAQQQAPNKTVDKA